jgi:hypothetical protein
MNPDELPVEDQAEPRLVRVQPDLRAALGVTGPGADEADDL